METAALAFLLLAALAALIVVSRRATLRDRRYRSLLDQLPETAVAVFDRDMRYVQVLGQAVDEGGLEPADFLGKRVDEVFPGEGGRLLRGRYRDALSGEASTIEFSSPLTGRDFWVRIAPLIERGEIVGGLAVSQNVSDRRRAERDLSSEARRRYLILDAMNEAYVATDGDGIVTGWNRAAEETFGWSAAEAVGSSIAELIIPEEKRHEFAELIERRLPDAPAAGRYDIRAERVAVHRDGRRFAVELNATLVELDGETVLLALMHDISGRKRAEAELRRHAEDVEALADAVGELARSTVAREARSAICRSAARIAGADIGVLFEPDPSGTGLRVTASEGAELVGRMLQFTQRSGAVSAFSSRELLFVSEVRDNPNFADADFPDTDVTSLLWIPVQHDEAALGVIAVAWRERVPELPERIGRVMSVMSAEAAVAIERAALLDRLERMASTDDLTGLTNRRAWDLELGRELVRAARDDTPLAVAMVDLDRFKAYNDRLGHQAGDRLLREAAGAWRGVLRETDLLARYGGEEFAIAMPGCDAETAADLVERLRAITPDGESCSAGLACWDRAETADELIGRADAALYAAKQGGRDRTIVI